LIQKIAFIFIFFFFTNISAQTFHFQKDTYVFYKNQNKFVKLLSEHTKEVQIVLYSIKAPFKFLQFFINQNYKLNFFPYPIWETDDPIKKWTQSAPLEGSTPQGVKFEKKFFYSQHIKNSKENLFLPIKKTGLYILVATSKAKKAIALINVSDLYLSLHQDSEKIELSLLNRETGKNEQGKVFLFGKVPQKNGMRNIKKNFLIEKNTIQIIRKRPNINFFDIVVQSSNSFDYKHLLPINKKFTSPYKVISLSDRDYYYKTNEISLYSFFYQKNKYGEYKGISDDSYSLIINNKTNIYPIHDNFYQIVHLSANLWKKAGSFPVITVFHDQCFTNNIIIINQNFKKEIVDIETKKQIYLAGEKIKGKIKIKNYGLKVLKNVGLRYEFKVDNKIIKKTKFHYGRGIHAFSLNTKDLKSTHNIVNLLVQVKHADNKIVTSMHKFYVYKNRESLNLITDKQVFLEDEKISGQITIKNFLDPFVEHKVKLAVYPYKNKTAFTQFLLSSKKEKIDFAFPLSYLGPLTLEAESLITGEKINKKIWLASYSRDMHLGKYAVKNFQIIIDKPYYEPGDIARILVLSEYKNINAFMEVKQNNIISSELIYLPFHSQLIDLPIAENYQPSINFFIQSVVSNKLISSEKKIIIPLNNKYIHYDVQKEDLKTNVIVKIIHKNNWDRPIQTIGLLSLQYENPFFDNSHINIFNEFYQNKKKKQNTFTIDENHVFNFGKETKKVLFYNETTNIINISKKQFNKKSFVLVQNYDLTKDAKIYSTNNKILLGNSLENYIIKPFSLFKNDTSTVSILIKNNQNVSKNYFIRVNQITSKKFIVLTNRTKIFPQNFLLFSDQFYVKPPFQLDYSIITHENQEQSFSSIGSRTLLTNLVPSDIIIKKTYKKIYLFGKGSKYHISSKKYQAESIVQVQIQIKKLFANNSAKLIDRLPSGFRFLRLANPNLGEYKANESTIIFHGPLTASKQKFTYYIKAEVPGRYVIPSVVILEDNKYYISKKKKKKFIYIKF